MPTVFLSDLIRLALTRFSGTLYLQGVPKKRTFRIIILQADTSERSPEAAWSLQARLEGLDGL